MKFQSPMSFLLQRFNWNVNTVTMGANINHVDTTCTESVCTYALGWVCTCVAMIQENLFTYQTSFHVLSNVNH